MVGLQALTQRLLKLVAAAKNTDECQAEEDAAHEAADDITSKKRTTITTVIYYPN